MCLNQQQWTHLSAPLRTNKLTNSSVCYPYCPFQGTLNSVSTTTYQNHTSSSVPHVNVQNGPSQAHDTTLATLISPCSLYVNILDEPNVSNPNCPFQDTLNTIHTLQDSNSSQTLTHHHVTVPTVASHVDPAKDQHTAISSVSYPHCPQGTPNSAPMLTSQDRISSSEQLPTNRNTKSYIHIVHWNAQGANQKTSVIKNAILQDDLDIVMIQGTRYKPRKDDTPQLKIHGYHTYHIPARPESHGLVTIVKKHNSISKSTTQCVWFRHGVPIH